ncbi:glycoside hydrolase family 10 protein, partial [Pseudomonas syringae]|nr:glycoside hydrolase family 10 protein [Pseudomonas syringae]
MATANKNLKATWVATVTNLDWPSVSSVAITDEAARVSKQKEELTGILDEI